MTSTIHPALGPIMTIGLIGLASLTNSSAATAQSAAERRETLAQITEKLNDPDPFMRLAFMEEILASGRALDAQIAIKMALASDDSDMRSLALRAYMSTVRDLRLDIALPPQAASDLEAAKGNDKKEKAATGRWRSVLFYYDGLSQRLNVAVEDAHMESGRFKVFAKNNLNSQDDRYSGEGSVVGTRIVFEINVFIPNQIRRCSVELSPGNDSVLRGEMSCAQASVPLPVEMGMY